MMMFLVDETKEKKTAPNIYLNDMKIYYSY